MNVYRNSRSSGRGFGLVEVMIVVTIIGILAVTASFSYRKYAQRSRLTECVTKIHEVRRLAWDYYYNEHRFPTKSAFYETYGGRADLADFEYSTDQDGKPGNGSKNCNSSDTNRGHGNECSGVDGDNKGNSTGFLSNPTMFQIVCTHDHSPVADYVFVGDSIPNAIIVKTIPSNP